MRPIPTPSAWPFPGPRAVEVPSKPVRPRKVRTYTYRVPDELRHLFAPGTLNPDGSVKQ